MELYEAVLAILGMFVVLHWMGKLEERFPRAAGRVLLALVLGWWVVVLGLISLLVWITLPIAK